MSYLEHSGSLCTPAPKNRITHSIPAILPWLPLFIGCGAVLNVPKGGGPMIDPLIKVERELKTAEGFFELAKNASSPFMKAYYRRVAERYLSSQGELKSAKARSDVASAVRPAIRM